MTLSVQTTARHASPRKLPGVYLLLSALAVTAIPVAYFVAGPVAGLLTLLVFATFAAFIKPIVAPVTVLLLSPLLGQFAFDHLGPFNAISILSLWFLAIGAAVIAVGNRIVLREKFLVIPLLLLALTAISILPSRHLSVTATEIIRAASAMMMLPVALVLGMRYRNRKMLVAAILASSVVPLSVGFYQKVTGNVSYGYQLTEFEMRSGLVRIYATFFDVHPFAKYLMVVLLLLLALIVTSPIKSRARWVYAALTAITFLAFIFTYARGQLISFMLGAFVLVYAAGKMRLRFLIVVIPLVFITFYYAGVFDRFEDIVEPPDLETLEGASRPSNSLERRFYIWGQARPLIRNGLVLGHGADTFQYAAGIIAHNDYLGLLYELGVGGLVLYMLFLIAAAWRTWRARRLPGLPAIDRALILAALGITIAIAIGSLAENLYRSTTMWWFYMAILGCALALTTGNSRTSKVGHTESVTV